MDDTASGQDRRTVLKMGGAAMLVSNSAKAAASDIVMMDARSLSKAIAAKKVSCAEVMTAYLDHIARLNPKVNAIVALQDREQLMAQAREHDAMLAKGQHMGVLHGFPHAVKDLQPVKGIVSTSGSPILKNFVPAADSIPVERMRAAGAIFIGKTNVPEFGLGSHTYNPVYGATHNAYDQSKSAGGSSGGAAVGLALHMLPVADGTDYGGSLRNPAGWNNVFGFRNSIGVVPSAGRGCVDAVHERRGRDGAQRCRTWRCCCRPRRGTTRARRCRWTEMARGFSRLLRRISKASASAG